LYTFSFFKLNLTKKKKNPNHLVVKVPEPHHFRNRGKTTSISLTEEQSKKYLTQKSATSELQAENKKDFSSSPLSCRIPSSKSKPQPIKVSSGTNIFRNSNSPLKQEVAPFKNEENKLPFFQRKITRNRTSLPSKPESPKKDSPNGGDKEAYFSKDKNNQETFSTNSSINSTATQTFSNIQNQAPPERNTPNPKKIQSQDIRNVPKNE